MWTKIKFKKFLQQKDLYRGENILKKNITVAANPGCDAVKLTVQYIGFIAILSRFPLEFLGKSGL